MQEARTHHSRGRALGLLVLASLLLGACGDAKPPTPPAAPTEARYTITANDDMKYDVERIEAKAGQTVSVTLKNIGSAPKFSMGHNFILLQRGTDAMKFIGESAEFANAEYIAPKLKSSVLAATKLLGPGESETIKFRAPTVEGEYDFVCSFPGHAAVGMRGKLAVVP